MRSPIFFRLESWLWKRRGLLLVTLASLVLRLWWNLSVHRPTDFAYSDMGGYLDRGNQLVDQPTLKGAWLALYPYGTHGFIGAIRWIFGRNNDTALGASFAALGAIAVAYTYATAERFLTNRWALRLTGLILIFYYPWIGLGGYTLSEVPFMACVAGSAFYGLRLADEGRRGDAWLLGLFFGLGAIVRPQILVAAALLGLHFLVRRRAWRHFRPGLSWRAATPLLIILALSAYRLHVHTEKWGLISTNGPLNFVFGRCHNTGLDAVTPNSRGFFGPPALGQILHYEKTHKSPPFFTLDPAFGERLQIQANMWDAEPNYKLAATCVKKTGYLRQLKFAVTHVVLLWGYNGIWPDLGRGYQLVKRFRPVQLMEVAGNTHNGLFAVPLWVAMLLAFGRRRGRWLLLSLHVWSVVITSMLYFGDTRYRAPYDGVIIVLAMQMYVVASEWIRTGLDRLRDLLGPRKAPAALPVPAQQA